MPSAGPRRALLALLLAPVIAGATAQSSPDNAAEQRFRAHVEQLADDRFEGRETGSRGHDLAAHYVARQFQLAGLEPGAPDGSWYQTVPLRRASHAAPPSLSYSTGGRRFALVDGRDFAVTPSVSEQRRELSAGLVFVGHGISEPAQGIDDYAGLDVRGRIAVALTGLPKGLPPGVGSHANDTKTRTAAAKGAVGFIEIDARREHPYRLSHLSQPQLDWVDEAGRVGRHTGAVQARIGLSEPWAQRLFDGAPHSLAKVRAEAAAGRPVRGFALRGRLSLSATSIWQARPSRQPIGLLRGSDPRLSAEHVVVMAHLDHLGIAADAAPGTDAIYNGAIDNAAGVATLIEVARGLAGPGSRPRRSVLFLANTGEEQQLLGADFFTSHPPVPLSDLVAAVDLDMPLLLYHFSDVVAFAGELSTLGATVAKAAETMGVAVSADPMPEEELIIRSDHYRFLQAGVPSVLLMTGYANGGEQAWRRFLASTYHRPSDDMSQPILWDAALRYTELNRRIVLALANAGERPRWTDDPLARRLADSRAQAAPKP